MRKHNGWRIAAVYTAVILGAGFASGQELLKYFVGYGVSGVWGLIVAGIVFSLTGWAVLDICRAEGLQTYSDFMSYLLGKRLGACTEWLVAAFLCVLFATMLAAAGATVKQGFNLPFTPAVLIAGVLCFIVLLFDLDGVVRLNTILAPFMVVGGIVVGLYTFFNRTAEVFADNRVMPGWVLAALVYASYNLVTGIPVLAASARLANRRRDCFTGGVLGGAAMTLLGICMALPLYLHYAKIISVEIPFLMIVIGYGPFFMGLYLAVMLCAVFTTAVSNAFAFMEWLCARFPINKKLAAAVLCAAGVAAAHVGFSNFVEYAYPLFGFLGFFEILMILLNRLISFHKDFLHPIKR